MKTISFVDFDNVNVTALATAIVSMTREGEISTRIMLSTGKVHLLQEPEGDHKVRLDLWAKALA